ncbi:mannose-6-phosphate isomerase, class I [Streptomyces lonarensis]|uniref:mannose-6-phosphate isomerase n=1 Tax=Streptomyces lonarensis TaxID=700599 RepID=A0A7X6I079_9ACTN|nr:mannose-6-phosphate isomerase, class I [Streptomyces lonarensis]NJQ07320.1 mannose-6-phosphate isomerase, class I [Streptomyces lonarensis]
MERLDTTVRPYAWGSTTAIPALLGVEPTGEPQAEMWLGAHPGAPSRLDRGAGPVSLADVIAADPDTEVGPEVHAAFGPRLPFLLKLLAADAPLSLQVHPDLAQAAAGHAAEEARGVPLDAPHRTYKDDQHKPELICALTPFEGLCGFRAPARTARLLDELGVPALAGHAAALREDRDGTALRQVFTAVLTAGRAAAGAADAPAAAEPGADDTTAATVAHVARAAARLASESGEFAAACAAYARLARSYPGDAGVIAALLLNHVRLAPGEALFLDAGVPHAYLGGLGVEIMAGSDNVLRCGLTPKHVDVPELLRIVRFTGGDPRVLLPVRDAHGEEHYETPVTEFRLSRRRLTADDAPVTPPAGRPQILLCTEGRVRLTAGDGAHTVLTPGQAAYVAASGPVPACTGEGTLFRATVAL